ncbi:MAG: adenosylmethionine decarboxylase [Pseudomonadota bacterium]
MKGLHIIADFYNCPHSEYLYSALALRQLCIRASESSGLTVLGDHFYQFDGFNTTQEGGATGALVLAESHLAIHTWPERAGATLDVYVCNVSGDNSDKAERLYAELVGRLKPAHIEVERVWRGKNLPIKAAA